MSPGTDRTVPPDHPREETPDSYSPSPFAGRYEARRAAFLEFVRRNPAPSRGSKAVYYEVARLAAGMAPHQAVIYRALEEFVDARRDCSDFVMHGILRLLYQFQIQQMRHNSTKIRFAQFAHPDQTSPGWMFLIYRYQQELF